MENNFKRYAIKIASLLSAIFLLYFFIANIVFLTLGIVKLRIETNGSIATMPFVEYIVVFTIIAVCYLIKYIDFVKFEENQTPEFSNNSKKHIALNLFISVCSFVFVVFLALFTGFACTSNYKKEKYELSYTENISVRNSESIVDDKVEVYYAINIISTNRKNSPLK